MRVDLLSCVKEVSKHLAYDQANASSFAQTLHVSRSVISQYLNEAYAQGELYKINTRPVIFFDCKTINDTLVEPLSEKEYVSIEEFDKALRANRKEDFEKLIGYHESLHDAVDRCRATISYPPNGMPVLLHGATGTGKSLIAQMMYEYCVNKQLIDKNAKFLILNCSEYANNPELLTANLFGSKKGAYTGADKDNLGMLHVAEGGVLFLDEIHALKFDCQEKLFLFMDKGMYHMLGDNETWYYANVRLLFATTEDPKKVLLKTLLRRIPMVIDLPSLADKGIYEKVELIYHLFHDEQKVLQREITFHNAVYNILLTTNFPGNIGGLKNCIKAACVNAYYRCQSINDRIEIHIQDLPQNLITMSDTYQKSSFHMEHEAMISLEEIRKHTRSERKQLQLHRNILNSYHDCQTGEIARADFLDQALQAIDTYREQAVFSHNIKLTKNYEYIMTILQHMLDVIISRYGFNISNNDRIMLLNYIYDYIGHTIESLQFCDEKKVEILSLNEYLACNIHREYLIAKEFIDNIKDTIDLEMGDMAISVITLYINKFQHDRGVNKRLAIILAHGYSTASSIADAANQLMEQYVFDSMDMPLQVSSNQMIHKVNNFLEKVGNIEELILLVDMGSLEDIYKGIAEHCNANIGIINNVTIKMALEVGNGFRQEKGIEEIFQNIEENAIPVHHIVHYHHKEKVILCTCASGMGTAEKLKKILQDSIPSTFPVKIMTYDYNELLDLDIMKVILQQYEIICAVGTLNPNLKDFPFIPIEDLIIDISLDKLHQYFQKYLSIEELKEFKYKILKNFSMTNLMDSLTILNPAKVLELVSQGLDRLQTMRHESFSNKTCVGLYVHVCCLIERLITGQMIDNYDGMEDFSREQGLFIKQVKESFSYIEHYYNVDINLEEIGYIYDYIEHNVKDVSA